MIFLGWFINFNLVDSNISSVNENLFTVGDSVSVAYFHLTFKFNGHDILGTTPSFTISVKLIAIVLKRPKKKKKKTYRDVRLRGAC